MSDQFKKTNEGDWEFLFELNSAGVAKMSLWIMDNYRLNHEGRELQFRFPTGTPHYTPHYSSLSLCDNTLGDESSALVFFGLWTSDPEAGDNWTMVCSQAIYELLVNQPVDNMRNIR